ncbi:hypothetical protein VTH06DRAFT_6102 [Thermothelomyces fergusii]
MGLQQLQLELALLQSQHIHRSPDVDDSATGHDPSENQTRFLEAKTTLARDRHQLLNEIFYQLYRNGTEQQPEQQTSTRSCKQHGTVWLNSKLEVLKLAIETQS